MSKPKIKMADVTELFKELATKRRDGGSLDGLGDDVPKEVKDALMSIIEGVDSTEPKKFTARIEAQAELLKYMATPMPKEGAFVERNDFGVKRYKSPKGDVESAIVVEVWKDYQQEVDGHGLVNGVVGFCDREGIVRTHQVDLRLYKEVEVAKATGTH